MATSCLSLMGSSRDQPSKASLFSRLGGVIITLMYRTIRQGPSPKFNSRRPQGHSCTHPPRVLTVRREPMNSFSRLQTGDAYTCASSESSSEKVHSWKYCHQERKSIPAIFLSAQSVVSMSIMHITTVCSTNGNQQITDQLSGRHGYQKIIHYTHILYSRCSSGKCVWKRWGEMLLPLWK